MAAERVLKAFLWVLATPLCIASLLLERFASNALRSDLQSALNSRAG